MIVFTEPFESSTLVSMPPRLGGIRQQFGRAPWGRRDGGHGAVRGHQAPVHGAPQVDDEEDDDLRDYVAELFVTNTLTGPVAQKIFYKADRAGAGGVSDLAKVGKSGQAKKNIHRDLMRKLMRGCTFPEPYFCSVPFLNKGTGEEEIHDFPVLLPHEALRWYIQNNDNRMALWAAKPEHSIFGEARAWCDKFEVDLVKFIPLGVHGDGVPFASKMRDSLECISYNIITDLSGVRILYTTFPKSWSAGKNTWDVLFRVFAWSMRHLMMGCCPRMREDGGAWKSSDDARANASGKALGFHAAVLQIRGDWAFYKEVFAFPHWKAKQCCWKCFAKNSPGEVGDFRDATANAPWRNMRISGHDFMRLQMAEGDNTIFLVFMPWHDSGHGDGGLVAHDGPGCAGRCDWQCVLGCVAFAQGPT